MGGGPLLPFHIAQSSKLLEKSCEIRRPVANCKAFRKRVR